MAVYTFAGSAGSGKSLYYAYRIIKELERIRKGKSSYRNIAINFDFHYKEHLCTYDPTIKKWSENGGILIGFNALEEVYQLRDTLVLVDEVANVASNRAWEDRDEDFRYWLTTHRHNVTDKKYRTDILLATQHKDMIDKSLRQISDRVYYIKKLFGERKNPDKFKKNLMPAFSIYYYFRHPVLEKDVREDDGTISTKVEELKWINSYYCGKKYYSAYDTHQTVFKAEKKVKKNKLSWANTV